MSDIFNKYREKTQQREQEALKEAKKIAYAIARKIVQEQLNEGAEIGGDQTNLIKKIAIRVLPKIKDKVLSRTKQFVTGSPMSNLGKEEHGEVNEGVNKMFVEYFGSGTMSTKWGGTRTPKDDDANAMGTDPQPAPIFQGTTPKAPVKIHLPSANGGPNPYIEFNPSDAPTVQDQQKEKLAHLAARKTGGGKTTSQRGVGANPEADSQAKNAVKLEAYTEVFERGLNEWQEGMKHTPEQYAFARVHSFINGGKSWKELDTDVAAYLEEGRAPGRAYVEPYNHPRTGEQIGWKSSTKWGRVKYWQPFAKKAAEKHAFGDQQETNENFIDGKGPGKPGDAARHGLKGKSEAELKKIRSSDTASPRKKQLAHWMLNMHHEEAEQNECWVPSDPTPSAEKQSKDMDKPVNRLFGTNALADNYRRNTPGQWPTDKWPANIDKSFKTAMSEDVFDSDVKGVIVPAYKRQRSDGTWVTIPSRSVKKRVRHKIIDDEQPGE
jgi:hypothetical protein